MVNFTIFEENEFLVPSDTIPNVTFIEQASEMVSIGGYTTIAFFMFVIFILGLTENSFSLFVFLSTRSLWTTNNVFVAGLLVSDWSQSVFGIPLVVASSISHKWLFGRPACIYYAFVTTFLGITQITTLTAISLDKYFVIVRKTQLAFLAEKSAVFIVVLCYLHGFIWALFPVVGWSSYELEGANVSCSIPWESKETQDISYCLSLTVFGWILPLGAIVYSYASICFLLRKEAAKPLRRSMKTNFRKKQMNREKSVAITVLIMIGAFVVSWMPYSVVSLIAVFGDPKQILLTVTMIPALFAKSSIIWNPIIYVARHKDFRKACLKHLTACGIVKLAVLLRSTNFSFTSKQTSEYYSLSMNQNVNKPQLCKLSQQNASSADNELTSNSTEKNGPFNSRDGKVNNRPKLTSKMRLETTSTDITAVSLEIEKDCLDELDHRNIETCLEEKVVEEPKSCVDDTDKTVSVTGFEEGSTNLEQTDRSKENIACSQIFMKKKTNHYFAVLETENHSNTVGTQTSQKDSCAIKNGHNSKGVEHIDFFKMNVPFVESEPECNRAEGKPFNDDLKAQDIFGRKQVRWCNYQDLYKKAPDRRILIRYRNNQKCLYDDSNNDGVKQKKTNEIKGKDVKRIFVTKRGTARTKRLRFKDMHQISTKHINSQRNSMLEIKNSCTTNGKRHSPRLCLTSNINTNLTAKDDLFHEKGTEATVQNDPNQDDCKEVANVDESVLQNTSKVKQEMERDFIDNYDIEKIIMHEGVDMTLLRTTYV